MNAHLNALKDIHLPAAVPWWDLAVGWWLLMLLGVLLLAVAAYRYPNIKHGMGKRRQRKALKQDIVLELQHIAQHFAHSHEHAVLLCELAVFLRRVGVTVFAQQHVQGMIGQAWLRFLDAQWMESTPSPSFVSPEIADLLQTAAYQSQLSAKQQQHSLELLEICQKWVKVVVKQHV